MCESEKKPCVMGRSPLRQSEGRMCEREKGPRTLRRAGELVAARSGPGKEEGRVVGQADIGVLRQGHLGARSAEGQDPA